MFFLIEKLPDGFILILLFVSFSESVRGDVIHIRAAVYQQFKYAGNICAELGGEGAVCSAFYGQDLTRLQTSSVERGVSVGVLRIEMRLRLKLCELLKKFANFNLN